MTEHTSDEGEATEFHGDEVHDTVYKAVLKRCYDLFSLFNSTFGSIMEKTQNNIDLLKLSVESFFNSVNLIFIVSLKFLCVMLIVPSYIKTGQM